MLTKNLPKLFFKNLTVTLTQKTEIFPVNSRQLKIKMFKKFNMQQIFLIVEPKYSIILKNDLKI